MKNLAVFISAISEIACTIICTIGVNILGSPLSQ